MSMGAIFGYLLLCGVVAISTPKAFGMGPGRTCYQTIVDHNGIVHVPEISVTRFDYDSAVVISGSPTSQFVLMRATKKGKSYILKVAQGAADSNPGGESAEAAISREYANYKRLHDVPGAEKYISGSVELKKSSSGLYLEIEDVGKLNLEDYFKNKKWNSSREAMTDFLNQALQSAEAANFIHKNRALHFDLSPDNIVVGPNGTRLIDFEGLAFQNSDGTYDFPGVYRKSNPPPELVGKAPKNIVGAATDIYSWADSMNQMYLSYIDPKIPKLFAKTPEQLLLKRLGNQFKDAIVKHNQARNPLERHQSMNEVTDILRAMLNELK